MSGEAPVAFSPQGERLVLDRDTPPDIPVLALVPAETDFDGDRTRSRLPRRGRRVVHTARRACT